MSTRKEPPKVLKGAAYTECSPISDVSHHKASASKAFLENHYRGMLRDTRSGNTARPVGPRPREPCVDDFVLVKRIGKGAFGEVYLCYKKYDNDKQLYALKRMRKTDMIRKKQISHVRSEKDVMAEAASTNPWVVKLYLSFQDEQYLYMVMEYMPGGDMISWLCIKQRFDVESTRFYIAELCAAVASVHDMFFVHRDIKPDNILLDAKGHIKLTDFGLSKRFAKVGEELLDLEEGNDALCSSNSSANLSNTCGSTCQGPNSVPVVSPHNPHSPTANYNSLTPAGSHASAHPQARRIFESIVGSPGYIAPEILLRQRYGVNCDWWSVGVIMYEMLYGIPPFFSSDTSSTCHKITHWREYLTYPSDRGVPPEATDLLRRLMCDQRDRLDFQGVKEHPFFNDIDWERLRETPPAFVPELSDPLDTHYFPEVEDNTPQQHHQRPDERNAVREVDPRGVIFADYKFNLKR
ncbi:protein kinase, putative [Trypanosoma brucei gambiense DAL972]|uniref:non-specific serine/threonine protein kinase n=3 Tax=Trypanosoma brucei TaxID=5691 RepID=C9ZTP2_TRYB9|nr:protein kinase, putative [Trypanosoma brucei gambiense DAL972]RHW71585.1 Nuclear Dbf2-related kinase [Trypanosoma brucei equiperdum]CBE70260.1 protein kinase [Trypanosoma brucei brucei]CBE70261.1 protein kinase [Trypanosoma brucei brucei]CBH12777.1 protein kinase, putative [Trypanosoma brucei gambiense DAL972]|eukprot:XP_011775057.1 protein kinase, putative [Trypanosoma brucei gambiense DAL972]